MRLTEVDSDIRISKFKPGDRVRCYDSCHDKRYKDGKVVKVFLCSIDVEHDDGKLGNYSPKQCRRLKKKEKRKAREIWVPEFSDIGLAKCENHQSKDDCEWNHRRTANFKRAVLFREVLEE